MRCALPVLRLWSSAVMRSFGTHAICGTDLGVLLSGNELCTCLPVLPIPVSCCCSNLIHYPPPPPKKSVQTPSSEGSRAPSRCEPPPLPPPPPPPPETICRKCREDRTGICIFRNVATHDLWHGF